MTDTPDQTRKVLKALADESEPADNSELAEWHALQEWLEGATNRVTIPYSSVLADEIPPIAVRLRRDFGMVLNLIRTRALLHQATRERDSKGRIVATLSDYGAVRELIWDLVAEGIEATVSETVRDTVKAVAALCKGTAGSTASVKQVADHLKLDKSTISRRVAACLEKGYLRNLETVKGKPYRLEPGDPLPESQVVLPTVEQLAGVLQCCSVVEGGIHPPSPTPSIDVEDDDYDPGKGFDDLAHEDGVPF